MRRKAEECERCGRTFGRTYYRVTTRQTENTVNLCKRCARLRCTRQRYDGGRNIVPLTDWQDYEYLQEAMYEFDS